MKKLLNVIIACALTFNLAACGGGGGSSDSSGSSTSTSSGSSSVTTLSHIDNTVGTGPVAANGNSLTVTYTGYLYQAGAANDEGTEFGSGPLTFTLGVGQVIAGWDQGLVGMQAGGTRTLTIPSSLAYGATGQGSIPPNAALVFVVTLNTLGS